MALLRYVSLTLVSLAFLQSNAIRLTRIAPFRHLLSHLRFLMTIRSQEGIYHGLILFRLSPSVPAARNEAYIDRENLKAMYKQIYVMESTCPHLGADMSHADIEEYDSGVVAVCPWHRKVLLKYLPARCELSKIR